MKIIIVGASGTMGKHLVKAFEANHEVITAASKGTPIKTIQGTKVIVSRNVLWYSGRTANISPKRYRNKVIDG